MPDDARDEHPTPDAPAVVIRLTRSGGVAGIRRTWLLVSEERDAWGRAIEACPWDDDTASAGADRIVWRVEVRAPLPARRATLPESAVEGPWRELVDRVRDEGDPVRPPRDDR